MSVWLRAYRDRLYELAKIFTVYYCKIFTVYYCEIFTVYYCKNIDG